MQSTVIQPGVIQAGAFLADAGTAVTVGILLVLLVAVVVLFLRTQSLASEIAELRREARKPAPAPVPATAPVGAPAPVAAPAAPVQPEPVLSPVPIPPGPPVNGDLVAILTAAAMACLGRRVAVRRITFINQNTVSGWAEAGRLSIHTSHNVRRN